MKSKSLSISKEDKAILNLERTIDPSKRCSEVRKKCNGGYYCDIEYRDSREEKRLPAIQLEFYCFSGFSSCNTYRNSLK